VLLEINGQLQSLVLPRTRSGGGPEFVQLAAANVQPQADVLAVSDAAGGDSGEEPAPSAAQRWFERLRPFTQSPASGGPGFAMRVGKKNRFGFQNGDVVTAINGHPVGDADSASQWLQQISESSIAVTVDRGGAPQTINVNVGD
jgi:hypothetical protein